MPPLPVTTILVDVYYPVAFTTFTLFILVAFAFCYVCCLIYVCLRAAFTRTAVITHGAFTVCQLITFVCVVRLRLITRLPFRLFYLQLIWFAFCVSLVAFVPRCRSVTRLLRSPVITRLRLRYVVYGCIPSYVCYRLPLLRLRIGLRCTLRSAPVVAVAFVYVRAFFTPFPRFGFWRLVWFTVTLVTLRSYAFEHFTFYAGAFCCVTRSAILIWLLLRCRPLLRCVTLFSGFFGFPVDYVYAVTLPLRMVERCFAHAFDSFTTVLRYGWTHRLLPQFPRIGLHRFFTHGLHVVCWFVVVLRLIGSSYVTVDVTLVVFVTVLLPLPFYVVPHPSFCVTVYVWLRTLRYYGYCSRWFPVYRWLRRWLLLVLRCPFLVSTFGCVWLRFVTLLHRCTQLHIPFVAHVYVGLPRLHVYVAVCVGARSTVTHCAV